jgi:hypothetical protein
VVAPDKFFYGQMKLQTCGVTNALAYIASTLVPEKTRYLKGVNIASAEEMVVVIWKKFSK